MMNEEVRKRIITVQLLILVLLISIIAFRTILLPKNPMSALSDSDRNLVWMDKVIKLKRAFIRNPNQTLILMSQDIKWLYQLRSDDSECYPVDDMTLFLHYCKNESRYPVFYDAQCVPMSMDIYERFLPQSGNTTTMPSFLEKFAHSFDRLIRHSEGLQMKMVAQVEQAFRYAQKIGHDCEHSLVWQQNFDPSLPSAPNNEQLWELYCLHNVSYPNLVSINSGKYYVPGYYHEKIQNPEQLSMDEKWMVQWMQDKFIPYYRNNQVLFDRYQKELNQSKQHAVQNRLKCLI